MIRVDSRAFRTKRNLLLAYASELATPIVRTIASTAARGRPTPPSTWRNGLILGHTHIGDVLYRTCSLPALRDALPNCDWTYAASSASVPVLSNNPHVREVLPLIQGEDSWNLAPGAYTELRARQFDVVLCTNTVRHHPDLALAARLGIPNRVGFTGKGFSGLITYPVSLRYPQPYAGYFREMVGAITGRIADWPLQPQLFTQAADVERAETILKALALNERRALVAVCLATRQAKGNWPVDVLLNAIDVAAQQRELDVVLCGSAADRAHLERVQRESKVPARLLTGEPLGVFAALLSKCSALVTLDSGPRHIGNAVGVPVVFARNLWHSKVEAGRYCATETDLAPDAEFLSDGEIERVTRSLPSSELARVILAKLKDSDTPA